MEDSGPGMATPEHWSDVGPLRGRLGVVEQQLQAVQARSRGSLGFMNCAKNIDVAQADGLDRQGQVSALGSQMAVMGQSLRQVEIQLRLGHIDMRDKLPSHGRVDQTGTECLKAALLCVAVADFRIPLQSSQHDNFEDDLPLIVAWKLHLAEWPSGCDRLSIIVPFTASEPDAPSTCPAHPESEPVEPLEPLEPVPEQVPEPVAPVAVPAVRPISSSPDHGEMAKPAFDPELNAELTSNPWEARSRAGLAVNAEDGRCAEAGDTRVGGREARDAGDAGLRELGHLRLSVSDCVGSLGLEESRALRQDHGFALACALRFREAVDVLQARRR
ncbi:unnamed protein product [Durusdinium trenchii]|uniref:Uncharacterized protein n=1 Tax=Durusdinium trenchii TaxID=1381693 RepID=A0ABP0Q2D4_9DINO